MTDPSLPSWWRVPRRVKASELRPGNLIREDSGRERRVQKVEVVMLGITVIDSLPGSKQRVTSERIGSHPAAAVDVIENGAEPPSNEALAHAIVAIETRTDASQYVEHEAVEELERRGWVERSWRLTPAGRMVYEATKRKHVR